MYKTIGEILDAIEKNNYKKAQRKLINYHLQPNNYFTDKNREPISACAIGQGAINLDVDAHDLQEKLSTIVIDSEGRITDYKGSALGYMIYSLNDATSNEVPTIARKVRERLNPETLKHRINLKSYHYPWKDK